MKSLPNWKTHKDCLQCGNQMYGQFDKYCSRCGEELANHDEWLADISDYAASLLIEFLEDNRDIALKTDFQEVPAIACEGINANATVECNSWATRHILAENWTYKAVLCNFEKHSGGKRKCLIIAKTR
jgi:ribosomal protein S27AE